jgi:hypothetical protein
MCANPQTTDETIVYKPGSSSHRQNAFLLHYGARLSISLKASANQRINRKQFDWISQKESFL